jgi:hypothetical protein
MPEAAFVMSARQHHPLRELAETLQYELALQGVAGSLHLDGFPEARPDRVYVLLDPRGYAEIEGPQALPGDDVMHRTVFICSEPPPRSGDEEHLRLLRRAGSVFVLDQRAVVAMHRLGVPARLLRPGHSTALDHFDGEAERPIDVMFLGTHSPRRTRYLAGAARVLSRHNCLLQIAEPVASAGDTSSFLAESRWPLLARTKVLVNLHRGEDDRFEWRRALDAIHAGAVVVTEHSSGIAPLVPGEHLLVAAADAVPFVVDALLRDEERLARLRSQAYERLSAWVPYALWVSVLRAAIVELVGEPVAPGTSLGTIAPRPAPAPSVRDDEVLAAPAARPAARLAVVHRSPAWSARRTPRVTAVMALTGSGETAVATLESLAHSRLRDTELVVVDAGGDVDAVLRWLQDRPRLAATLLAPSPAANVGTARNVGADFARSPFCLILDAHQEVYPRCLDVLAGTLEAMPEMAFVYPMQEVTGEPAAFADAGGDHVMSFLGWDPGRLRLGNHIHAPALIRTERLREIGGFATDPRLDGFEDYDLWCRMAERGWSGQLVAQELARRSESGSSAALAAIHPSPGPAVSALTERAPRLLAGAFPAR